ncbi:MAG: hypothetical protein PVH65_06445 [Chloroflexota bacterium]
MSTSRRRASWLLAGLLLMAWALLTSCERPDPQEAVVLSPTLSPSPLPSATTGPTQAPVQVYVVVVQPTAPASPTPPTQLQVAAPTATPAAPLPTATVAGTGTPTAVPEGFYLGWAWTDSLQVSGEQATVDQYGILLRDRPSRTGREVGLVVGLADLVVVGQGRCGYTPVLVHEYNLLSHMSPQPQIATSQPLPTEAPPFAPTPRPEIGNVVSGWAYSDELTILGETAISGPLGVNLRSDPCPGATNLGFIPAGANMIVTGWPNGDYTPVRINRELLQPPLDILAQPRVLIDELSSGAPAGGPSPAATPTLLPTLTTTGTITATATAAATATATITGTPSSVGGS